MKGQGGNDEIYGGTGNDWIFGGDGNDVLFGGDGDDIISTGTFYTTLPPFVSDSDYADGGAGNDRLKAGTGDATLTGGSGNDTVEGYRGNDYLLGDDGNDRVVGEDGNDRLTGGSGYDTLNGGAGADKFIFWDRDYDVIQDFKWQEGDKIQVVGWRFGATSLGQFNYDHTTGALSFNQSVFAVLANKPQDFAVNLDITII